VYDIEVEKPRHSYDTKRKMQCVYGIEVRKPRHSYNFIDIKNKSKSNLARFFGKNHDKLNTYRKKCWDIPKRKMQWVYGIEVENLDNIAVKKEK